MKTVITLYTLFVAISTCVLGAPALAEPQLRQRVVDYSDLNLKHSKGVETLYRRIRTAARAVCEQPSPVFLRKRTAERQCSAKAIEDAVRDVNNVNLTAYHIERTGEESASGEKLAGRK